VRNDNCRNVRLQNNGTGTLAGLAAAVVIAACGSDSPSSSGSSGSSGSNPSQAQAQQEGLSFARCMRSHGVSSFPDPTPNGGGSNVSAPGINSSSPAFKAAQTACQDLLPVKHVQSEPPSAQAYARLLHWAKCMREHGISGLLDPRPDPPPAPGTPGTNGIGTLMGDGGYWVGIPATVDAHSPAFVRLSTACGESPGGHKA
jgi:hypothetical protein